jgi:hypothetical protein
MLSFCKRLLVASLAALAGCATAAAADQQSTVKTVLTPEGLPGVLALIRPQQNEWRHLKVRWLTDVVAARKRAAAEDRPIVVCYTGGAGYNEPLGVC